MLRHAEKNDLADHEKFFNSTKEELEFYVKLGLAKYKNRIRMKEYSKDFTIEKMDTLETIFSEEIQTFLDFIPTTTGDRRSKIHGIMHKLGIVEEVYTLFNFAKGTLVLGKNGDKDYKKDKSFYSASPEKLIYYIKLGIELRSKI